MSLRWIQENQEAPICDEESSDIENSSCDDSADDPDDHISVQEDDASADPDDNGHQRQKRETFRHPTTTVSLKDIRGAICIMDKICGFFEFRKEALNKHYNPNDLPTGNPTYGPVMQLYCQTGYRLAILPCGRIYGFDATNNPFAVLKITSVAPAVVQIQGMETGRYLAFNERGRLYGERNKDKDNTTWKHFLFGSYDSYLSQKYADREWYAGIKKNGRPKNGKKTAPNQKATKFLPIR